jgi:hypothetical protein
MKEAFQENWRRVSSASTKDDTKESIYQNQIVEKIKITNHS